MLVTYNKSLLGNWIIEVCDCNLDLDFGDYCSWIIPGTIDSDYNRI